MKQSSVLIPPTIEIVASATKSAQADYEIQSACADFAFGKVIWVASVSETDSRQIVGIADWNLNGKLCLSTQL